MKKDTKKNVLPIPETTQNKEISTSLTEENQDQFPFLYMTMREPSKEYKDIPKSKDKLYRIIKIK